MQSDDALVTLVGLGPPVFLDYVAKPVRQVLRDRPVHRRDRHALVGLLNELHYLLAGVVTGVGVNADYRASKHTKIEQAAIAADPAQA